MNKLKIQFESRQEHQIKAIQSTVKLFDGYSKQTSNFQMGEDTIPNLDRYETLDESWLFDNLVSVQQENRLVQDMQLNCEDGFEMVGIDSWRYPYYTLDMETGTGKTYVYLRTIHELRKNYGWGKFVIVVPSVAIYEGVVKTFHITKEHFKTLYGNETINLIEYSGQKISKLRTFSSSSNIEILLMTIDSFNRETNVLFKPTEKLQGEKLPYEYIQETRPILILDESQNYTSEKSRQALRTLHPLFALKYSATPTEKGGTKEEDRELMNRCYWLSPVDAFRQDLVKKIEVVGVTEQANFNDSQLSLALDPSSKYGLVVEANLYVLKDGLLTQKSFRLKKGDDLFQKTNNPTYQDLVIRDIDRKEGVVIFENEQVLKIGEGGEVTLSKEEIFRVQIEETLKAHMIKQKQLLDHNIKVLSLFFIDKVANYVANDGVIKKLFDEAYDSIKQAYPFYKGYTAEQVREGYFAKKTAKNKPDEFVDTGIEKKTQKEKELEKIAYNLIMKDKERLLHFDEKVCFIFAHSALKEGWDNPNVFQICTLNTATSEKRKRQEIGRGLRIAVNQEGQRVQDEGVNVLTVVANESYESYCEQLQSDYVANGDVPPPNPSNARKAPAKRNDAIFKSEDFQMFWEKLCRKTAYTIEMDEDALIKDCIAQLNIAKYPEPNIVVMKGKFVMTTFKITLEKVEADMARLVIDIADFSGNEETKKAWFNKGDDLAKKARDERLKGYKIVEIKSEGEHSVVYFGDHDPLRVNESHVFTSEKGQKGDPQSRQEAQTTYPVFNFIDRTAQTTSLKKTCVLQIFKGLNEEVKKRIFKNPEGFSSVFTETIKNTLANHIAEKIEYTLTEELMDYQAESMFPASRRFPQKELVEGVDWSLYDQVQIDSDVERKFVEYKLNDATEADKIVCYFKFPNQFKISIPKIIGNYNPDWGIIRWDDDQKLKLELVRETKGNVNPNLLQFPNEKRKIDCATKHFALTGIHYKQISGEETKWW
ncbi:MAG: DEAD/DEAH box helicase family protein [Bacteroidota bacterium]